MTRQPSHRSSSAVAESSAPRHRQKRKRSWPIIAIASAVVVAIIGGGVVAAIVLSRGDASSTVDLKGAPVRIDPADQPSAQQLAVMKAVESTGTRFSIPSVKLDVPLGEVSSVDNTIVPPGFTSVYRVRDFGVPLAKSSEGTVYLVTHSARGGAVAPGNYLEDEKSRAAAVAVGAAVNVGDLRYRVTGAHTVAKQDLPNSPIWNSVPGRLLIITCLQNDAGTASTENLVITAELAS